MSAPGERRDCPVLTCKATIPADQTMCATCYGALPKYMQVALDVVVRDVRRQPTARNRKRLDTAVVNAVRMAATVRS
ncbi:MAG: hypothetical protein Q8K89_12335 [Actinomycetota bacterium]|nr:hypothetical protein [Actinomycetota bacterium]